MTDVQINGLILPPSSTVTVVILPAHPDRTAATVAASRLVTELTGKLASVMTDWDESVTVATGRRDADLGDTPALTADQQLAEDMAALYRRTVDSAAITDRNPAVYGKMRDALRGMIEAAWGLRTATAREMVRLLDEDDRPVWAIVHEEKGVPLVLVA